MLAVLQGRFFTSEQKPVYYGKAPSLYEKVFRPAGAQTSSYALFAGGYTGGVTTDSVTEYSESLTRSSNRLGETKYRMVSVSHKGYAIFSGGYYEDADDHSGALESATCLILIQPESLYQLCQELQLMALGRALVTMQ